MSYQSRVNKDTPIRDIDSLGLTVEQKAAAVAACRQATAERGEGWTPCVDRNGHCCVRCETIGRGASK